MSASTPAPADLARSTSTRPIVLLAAVVLVAVAALGWRIATVAAPPLAFERTIPAHVRLPGASPRLAWPVEGEAAVGVAGVGYMGSSGGSAPVPIASVAKVMTAYLTLMEHPLSAGGVGFAIEVTPAEVEEGRRRAALGESTVALRAGERLSELEALQALMLPSGNNVAALLAQRSPGGTATFVARMNATARALGMDSTRYTDPSGFDASTVSTAADQLKLVGVAMGVPELARIVAERSAVLPVAGRVRNLDGLLGLEGYVGVKTGSDRAAGGCLAFAKRTVVDGHRLTVLGVVLGQRQGELIEAALGSARELGNSAAAAIGVETALPAKRPVLSARNADGERAAAVTATAVREIGWGGLRVRVGLDPVPSLTRMRGGERLTSVSVHGAGGRTPVVAAASLGGPSLEWRLSHLL